MKAVGFILIFVLALASGYVVKVDNGFADEKYDPKKIQISSIDKKDAESLFKAMASDKDISYKFARDGCYARATAMARIAEKRDIKVGKIFAEGILQAELSDGPLPVARWGWHVAPVVFVKTKGSKSVPMVFDPVLFDRPATEDEWKQKLLHETPDYKPRLDKVYYGSRFQYKIDLLEGNKSNWREWDLKNTKEVMERYREYEKLGADLPRAAWPFGGAN
jgi:hypothetical protein